MRLSEKAVVRLFPQPFRKKRLYWSSLRRKVEDELISERELCRKCTRALRPRARFFKVTFHLHRNDELKLLHNFSSKRKRDRTRIKRRHQDRTLSLHKTIPVKTSFLLASIYITAYKRRQSDVPCNTLE